MDRRTSLKLIAAGVIAAPTVIGGCKPDEREQIVETPVPEFTIDRNPDELKNEQRLLDEEIFFSAHEMATITVLCDIIIPRDDTGESASEAGVPAFIEFIVKDMPSHQTPLRGGLRWLDSESNRRYAKHFKDLAESDQLAIVDDIAYPEIEYVENGKTVTKGSVRPGMEPGVAFFSLMRNLTATGYYTSAPGVKDIGYQGNTPNQWNGVPAEVLKQYGISYTGKDLKDCVSFGNI